MKGSVGSYLQISKKALQVENPLLKHCQCLSEMLMLTLVTRVDGLDL